jgi:hypothetical protein
VKFAYADPPYLGCGARYDEHHPNARDWNEPETHRRLVERLNDEYSDGWAMSLSSPSLKTILPMCPSDVRVMAWVKPFASFKPNVNPAYAWEPVIVRGGRKRTREELTVRDFVSVGITMQKGLCGAKPEAFCVWVFDVLGIQQGDELDDLFPGTGIVGRALNGYLRQGVLFGSTG